MTRYKNSAILTVIGQRIKKKREQLNLEIEDLAEMTGFSYNTIDNIESGSETYITYFIEVCFAIQSHPKEILDFRMNLNPRFELTASRKEKSRLTKRIQNYIADDYFLEPKTTKEVVQKLQRDYSLNVKSAAVSVILNRFLKKTKKGNRNLYYK